MGDDDAFYPEDPNSPEVLRVRQEQAYRSVGALQLRVEELTLEVTKVGKKSWSFLVELFVANHILSSSCWKSGTPFS